MKAKVSVVMMAAAAALFAAGMSLRASKMDDRIESSARKSYIFKTYLTGDNIEIHSKDGFVTLTGMVSEESHKSLAYETVSGLPGTKGVDNKLQLKGAQPDPLSDAWVGEKVKMSLLFHRSVRGGTKVEVKNGNVTLRGEASDQAQKELTTEYTKDVDGVKDVDNRMAVAGPSKTMVQKASKNIDDASITAQVKMTLLFHRSTSAHNTKVTTNNGMVTLNGNASNPAEKELVTKLVDDINGVKSVNNQMTVN